MAKIFLFADQFYTTHPYLEIPLYNELNSRNIDVVFVLQENDIRLTDINLAKVYGALNLQTIRKPKHLGGLFGAGDVLVMRWMYKLGGADAAQSVISKRNKVLMYDVPGIDIRLRKAPATYVAVKGVSLTKQVKKNYPQYKGVFSTGLLHADEIINVHVNKEEFMLENGMDPSKKMLLLTPANPGEAHMKGLKQDYTKIVNIVKKYCPEFELAVKAHPNDYTAKISAQPGIVHKNQHYQGKCSWEVFAPGIKVIKAHEGYKAIRACDAIINVRSSLAMELSHFKKPLINVNRKKYITNWPFDANCMMDISDDQLADVLNNEKYSSNKDAWKKYVDQHMHSDDGNAYKRIADLADKIINNHL